MVKRRMTGLCVRLFARLIAWFFINVPTDDSSLIRDVLTHPFVLSPLRACG